MYCHGEGIGMRIWGMLYYNQLDVEKHKEIMLVVLNFKAST